MSADDTPDERFLVKPEAILDRWNLLLDAFEDFRISYKQKAVDGIDFEIDPAILYVIVESYFFDIERYKIWHETERADSTKKFAFTIYWLMKKRPIYSQREANEVIEMLGKNPNALESDPAVLLNAEFAILAASNFLKVTFSEDLMADFIYGLTYREFTKDGLLMMAMMLRSLGESKSPDVKTYKAWRKD